MFSQPVEKAFVWLMRLVFGLLLPFCLVWFLLSGYYGSYCRAAVAEAYEQLNLRLDYLEKYHEDRVFFHSLFLENFSRIDKGAFSPESLARTINGFRKAWSGKIRFIVWNRDGVVDNKLSDEKRFQFILKTMFSVIQLLRRAYEADNDADPLAVAQITDKMNLLRGYFGLFLFQNQLFDPLRRSYTGKCLYVAMEKQKRLLWYYPGEQFSLACFIDSDLTDIGVGPATIIRHNNQQGSPQKLAYIRTIANKFYGFPESASERIELALEARKFASNGASPRESANFFIHLRQVSSDLVIFSYQKKNGLNEPQPLVISKLFLLAKWLLVMFFVGYCYSLRLKGWCLSVHQKMVLLFVFANGLPILLMVSTGYEYFQVKRSELIDQTHQESLRILKEFDVRFPQIASDLAKQLNEFIDGKNALYKGERWSEADVSALKEIAAAIQPEEGGLWENSGEYKFYIANTSQRASRLGQDLMQRALDFFGSKANEKNPKGRVSMLDQVSADDKALYFFLKALDRFSVLSSGNSERLTYIKFAGDLSQSKVWGVLLLSWEKAAFMKAFVGEKLKAVAVEVAPRLLAVMDKGSERIISPGRIDSPEIRRLMRQTRSRKMITRENVEFEGKRYLFSSISGNEVSEGILVALYPQDLIEKRISHLKLSIGTWILLTVFILLQIVKLFSQRLLAPVSGLANGINRVKRHDYSTRVEVQSADELGKLITAFNQTVEGLQELAIGTAVQVSLLPAGNYRRGKAELFARSVFMSKMGGDYYDYFDLPDAHLGIFFGDVAGHGIPAAMIMAMTKALITSVSQSFPGPSEVLFRGSQVLHELKKRNWKRMMTAQCLDFDCQTGRFTIANAGHCYPMIIGNSGKNPHLLEIAGFPLGSSAKNRSAEFNDCLQPGDTLILYTDGIIEATNSNGEMLGYTRFQQLIQGAWHEDLETFWGRIYDAYKAWAVTQDDDLTFLMLRYEENQHE